MREIFLVSYKKPIASNKKTKYTAKIGFTIYAMLKTQIYITFVTSMVSRFAKILGLDHFSTVDQILTNLANSQDRNITFKGESILHVVGYLNSDWTIDYANKKSILRFVFILNRGSISYYSKKQAVIALLSIQAKYVALCLVA